MLQIISKNAEVVYKTKGSAGFDLYARLREPVIIGQGCRMVIATGVWIRPDTRSLLYWVAKLLGFSPELQVRSRSGLALKKGLIVANSPGTIDESYPDEVGVILINASEKVLTINNGDPIAQGVVALAYVRARGTKQAQIERIGGFGSTEGKK